LRLIAGDGFCEATGGGDSQKNTIEVVGVHRWEFHCRQIISKIKVNAYRKEKKSVAWFVSTVLVNLN